MEIERINEDTIKFYISYLDLEERGFNQEDVGMIARKVKSFSGI